MQVEIYTKPEIEQPDFLANLLRDLSAERRYPDLSEGNCHRSIAERGDKSIVITRCYDRDARDVGASVIEVHLHVFANGSERAAFIASERRRVRRVWQNQRLADLVNQTALEAALLVDTHTGELIAAAQTRDADTQKIAALVAEMHQTGAQLCKLLRRGRFRRIMVRMEIGHLLIESCDFGGTMALAALVHGDNKSPALWLDVSRACDDLRVVFD